MRPQHLLLTVPFALSAGRIDAFVSPTGQPFLNRDNAVAPSSTILMDSESHIDGQMHNFMEQEMGEAAKLLKQFNAHSSSTLSVEQAEVVHGMPWTDTIGKSNEEEPLLYMYFWEWQMKFMKDNLTNLRPHDCVTEYAYNDNKDKKARIVNQCYQSDEYRKIRMTYYDAGDSTQVFNSVWYPDPAYNLPVLGIDLLSFNRKKYLAIVDFQPIHEEESDHAIEYEHRLQPIKDKYESLKGRMSSKFYDETQFFSEQMLFARFSEEEVVSRDLFPAFQQYVKLHTELITETTPNCSTTEQEFVLKRQQAYDTYSAERDPATALFANMFGKEWADEFVFDFLFSLSEKKDGGLVVPPMFGGGGPPPGASGGPSHGGNPMKAQHSKNVTPSTLKAGGP